MWLVFTKTKLYFENNFYALKCQTMTEPMFFTLEQTRNVFRQRDTANKNLFKTA